MAKYNKTALKSRINSLLPDNVIQEITPAILRGVLEDFVDSLKSEDDFIKLDSKSSGFTPVATHLGSTIDATTGLTCNLPDGYPDGYWFVMSNVSAGQVDFAASNPIESDGTILDTKFTSALVLHIGANVWRIEGRLN